MSIQAVAWAIRQKTGSPTGKVLLICLANYADEEGKCWPSQTTISVETELGERSTRDWLKRLEKLGFISRSRRHRTDGTRTSDMIILCMGGNAQENNGNIQPAKSAGRGPQPAHNAEATGISYQSYRHQMPGNLLEEPPEEPSPTGSLPYEEQWKGLFEKIWKVWDQVSLPDFRDSAKRVFRKLSLPDQLTAANNAEKYCALCRAQCRPPLLFPYLKERLFADLEDSPEIDTDGNYVITPDRPEWQPSMAYLRKEYGKKAVERATKYGKYLTKTRWPKARSTPHSDQIRTHRGRSECLT